MEEQLARRTKGTEEIESASAATKQVLERFKDFTVPAVAKVEQITANGVTSNPLSTTTSEAIIASEDLHLFEMLQSITT